MHFGKLWFLRYALGLHFFCPPDPDPAGPTPPNPPAPAPDLAAENAALKAELARYQAAPKPPDPKPDPDLNQAAAAARAAADKDSARIKRLESSITFNMKSADFLKANASLLPNEVSEIFQAAEKETYADSAEKADAIKAGLIQAFFAVQENLDLLTAGQKAQLDDYLKLTKNSKQEKAQSIYDLVFEPAFEMLKRTKRAQALNGAHAGSSAEEAYKNKLIDGSTKHYRLEKK